MTMLQGPLADRDAWSAIGECPIEKAMTVVGQKSAMLIMREAYYGTTRFDDFSRRVGITRAATSARLSELVSAGLLEKRPYREVGQRERQEYVLTEAGVDFMPVVWSMFEWGRKHLPYNGRMGLTHRGCDADAHVEIVCEKGHSVSFGELGMRLVRPDGGPRRLGRSRPPSTVSG